MDKQDKIKLRNRLWSRFSKFAPVKNIRSFAQRFRVAFTEVFCKSVASEPQTPSQSVSEVEAPLESTSEHIPFVEEFSPEKNSGSAFLETHGPETTCHVSDRILPAKEGIQKLQRPLYRPRPLKMSDVEKKHDIHRFVAADPRVKFVEKKYPNGTHRSLCEERRVAVVMQYQCPSHYVDETEASPLDINVDEMIRELDDIINSRPDTTMVAAATGESNIDAVISELDEIIQAGESREAARVVPTNAFQAEEKVAPEIDDIIDEEYNYYGI